MADRERLLARLRKLLALRDSPNGHEAAAARAAAESLMLRHGLTEAEAAAEPRTGYYELPMGARGWGSAWRFALVTVAARSCGAEAVALQSGSRRKVRIVGERADVECARDLYLQLLEVVRGVERRAASEYAEELVELASWGGARAGADSFRRGVVHQLAVMLLGRRRPDPGAGGPYPAADPVVPASSLARVGRHAGRLKNKYDPQERPIDLDDATVPLMFEMGRRLAGTWLSLGPDGGVRLKGESPSGGAGSRREGEA